MWTVASSPTWASRCSSRSSCFFFSSRRRHTRFDCDWSSDVCSSDLLLALGGKLLLLRLPPRLAADQIGPQSRDRLLFPARLHFLGRAVACGVVRGGMVAEPIGDGLDQTRPAAGAGSRNRLLGGGPNRKDVVAVHLLARESGADRLLSPGRGLRLQ